MNKLIVAAIQMDTQSDKEANLRKAESLIDEAAARGAELVGLPEYFNFLGPEAEEAAQAEPIPGPTIERLAAKAKDRRIWLHCGSIAEKIPGSPKMGNTTVLLNPFGDIAAIYRKIHLFDIEITNGPAMMESGTKVFGDKVVVVDTDLGSLGFSICYDLRFPELYRAMAVRGATIIMVPAEFTAHTGKDHWEVLLRARAIENQCYVIAPAQIGKKPLFPAYGRSLIVDPWGIVLAKAPDQECVITAEVDMEALGRIREQLPSLMNRRLKVSEDFR